MIQAKKIALIHALEESKKPVWNSFHELWPEAILTNYSDLSLSIDRKLMQNENTIGKRINELAKIATAENVDAILYTCSAFGDEINQVKDQYSIPILRPNEAAFYDAIHLKQKIKILVTFLPSLELLMTEVKSVMIEFNIQLEVEGAYVEDALSLLQSGSVSEHDKRITNLALDSDDSCTLILGQFSMATALSQINKRKPGLRVLTTPESSVLRLKRLLSSELS